MSARFFQPIQNALRRQRQLPIAHPRGIKDCVGQRGPRGPLRGFARAEERLAWSRYDVDIDTRRRGGEAQDRVARPVRARHFVLIEGHGFIERPARRLQDAALGLVDDAVGVDGLAAVLQQEPQDSELLLQTLIPLVSASMAQRLPH